MTPELLPDIPRGPTWSPEFKHQCLLRSIAARPKAQRQVIYAMWAKRNGDTAAKRLAAEVSNAWRFSA